MCIRLYIFKENFSFPWKPITFLEQIMRKWFYCTVQFSRYLAYHYFLSLFPCVLNVSLYSQMQEFLICDFQTEYAKQPFKLSKNKYVGYFKIYSGFIFHFFPRVQVPRNTIFLASKHAFHCDMKWCISPPNVLWDIKLIMLFLWIQYFSFIDGVHQTLVMICVHQTPGSHIQKVVDKSHYAMGM